MTDLVEIKHILDLIHGSITMWLWLYFVFRAGTDQHLEFCRSAFIGVPLIILISLAAVDAVAS